MQRLTPLLVLLLSLPAAAPDARAQSQEQAPALEARVWLDRGEEPVLQRGDQVRVYYRTSEDAYAAIFHIDTDGEIALVFPQHPGATGPVRGGRDYRLLFPSTPTWIVGDDPGSGYFFIVASPAPLDFSWFGFDERSGWDLSAVGSAVYEDPYVAIDDYVAAIVPDWEFVPYGLDFLTYHVGSTHAYPRFLCYDCHTPRPYVAWNPYSAVCTSFRVVIWDDPYFYPTYRYAGTRVVVARPARSLPRYEVAARGPNDIGVRPLVRPRAAPPRGIAQFKESPTVDPSSRIPVRRSAPAAAPGPGASRAAGADSRGGAAAGPATLQRRPASTAAPLPTRTPSTRRTDPGASRDAARGATRAAPSARAAPAPRSDARRSGPQAAPSRAPAARPSRATPSRPSAAPSPRPTSRAPAVGGRSPARSGGERPAAAPARRPARSSAPPGRSGARPAPSAPSRPAARPSAAPARRPTARPAPAARGSTPRAGAPPKRRGGG